MRNVLKLFIISALFTSCTNVPKMYREYEAKQKKPYPNSSAAFAAVKPTITIPLDTRTTIELGDRDPIVMTDPENDNNGYFKIVNILVPKKDTYSIKAYLNCRCFGKLSGKNAVCARMYLWDTNLKKIIPSKPGLVEDSGLFSGASYNALEAPLEAGKYRLLVAVDNRFRGGEMNSVPLYGVSNLLSVGIYGAPDGAVDLIVEKKSN